jgi:hypothetical protein
MNFPSEIHSGDVNKHSGPGQKVHSFQPGIDIHISPESVFTSLRNRYSHAPEYAIAFLDRCEANGITLKNCPAYIREWIKGQRGES